MKEKFAQHKDFTKQDQLTIQTLISDEFNIPADVEASF